MKSKSKPKLTEQEEEEIRFEKNVLKSESLSENDKNTLSYYLKQMENKSVEDLSNDLRESYM